MGRIAATAVHLTLCVVAGVGYFLFIIPRWWELMGDTSHTVGTVVRIATGVFVTLAALPVILTLVRTRQPEYRTPALALTLRSWSTVAHVVAGVLITATAIAEIWISLDSAGPWLYGVYGAALAVAILGATAFYLSFVAEKAPAPPKPPKPPKAKQVKKKRGEKADETAGSEEATDSDAAAESEETPEPDDTVEPDDTAKPTPTPEPEPEKADEPATADKSDEPQSAADPEPPADTDTEERDEPGSEPESQGGLRNKRPSGKSGHRLRRSAARGGITVEE